ncbi:alpha/beta hydrolase [Nocardioides sp. C4-1]|uniref:alpha/beta hydrolase n=1 Tax=Nocardioides sp. C4-1 TaxID=3151851 RepID=UPI003267EB34
MGSATSPAAPRRRPGHRRLPTRTIVAATIAALVGGLLTSAPSSADDAASARAAASSSDRRTADERQVDRVATPRLSWRRCGAGLRAGAPRGRLQCAVVRVPLDYDRPDGATTPLRIARLKASGPRRVGSLFVNPGGPGGPSASFVTTAASLLGPRVGAGFDVVGVDPRGTGRSGRVTCRTTARPSPLGFPLGAAQVKAWIKTDDALRRSCASRGSRLLGHASTADVARDMDLVRRALGESQLTYYGISYGSYLGATYAALFPSRVRALVVDGVLDPVAWSTGNRSRAASTPQTTRLRSGYGAYEALTSALTECDRVGPRRCAIAPNALGAWKRVVAAARAGRLAIEDVELTYQDIVGLALGTLYDRRMIPFLFELIGLIDEVIVSTAARGRTGGAGGTERARKVRVPATEAYRRVVASRDALRERGLYTAPQAPRPARRLDVQFPAVLCSDGRNPRSPARWEQASKIADRQSPWFGRVWTWASSPCARQGIGSGDDSFRGPWAGTRTSYPLLVVGNTHDPATPISGARRLNTRFDDSVLVTYDGWGHGALGGGRCITSVMADYLVDRTLPPDGTVCRQPRELFR